MNYPLSQKIYLDYNATTPLHPKVKRHAVEMLDVYGNASSVHWTGRDSKRTLVKARKNASDFFGVNPTEIIFVSGGSEANNQAIKTGVPFRPKGEKNEIWISAVEHPSVVKAAHTLEKRGYLIKEIPVSRTGEIDLVDLKKI